jgi:hypothetical protein
LTRKLSVSLCFSCAAQPQNDLHASWMSPAVAGGWYRDPLARAGCRSCTSQTCQTVPLPRGVPSTKESSEVRRGAVEVRAYVDVVSQKHSNATAANESQSGRVWFQQHLWGAASNKLWSHGESLAIINLGADDWCDCQEPRQEVSERSCYLPPM